MLLIKAEGGHTALIPAVERHTVMWGWNEARCLYSSIAFPAFSSHLLTVVKRAADGKWEGIHGSLRLSVTCLSSQHEMGLAWIVSAARLFSWSMVM